MRTTAWVLAGAIAVATAVAGCQSERSEAVRIDHDLAAWVHGRGHVQRVGRLVSKGLRERGNGFIGDVRFSLTQPNAPARTVDYTIEEGKVRYDLMGAGGRSRAHVVADLPARTAFAVLPRSGGEVMLAPVTGPGDPAPDVFDSVEVRRPNRIDHVAGRLCEEWDISTTTHDVQVCATSGISWFDLVPKWSTDHLEPRWSAELSRDRYFPLRVIVRDKQGHEQERLQATQIRERPVDDSLMAPPRQAHVAAALPGSTLPSAA